MVFDIIEKLNINLVISFYMNGVVANLRVKNKEPLFSVGHKFRPMGMFFGDQDGWVAGHSELTYYRKFERDGYELFRPVVSHFTGAIDSHELVVVNDVPVVNATLFNKMATLDPDPLADFKPVYTPSYCEDTLEPKDTHHVNGIGLRNDKIRYVTSFSDREIHEPKGWKDFKGTGVVWDILEDEPVISNLYLPHSPRYHEGYLYVCNSGTGEFIRYKDGKDERIQTLSFIRGVAFCEDYIFVGGSITRGKPSSHVNKDRVKDNKCQLFVIDKKEFKILGSIDFNKEFPAPEEEGGEKRELREIFDIAILPQDTLVATAASEGYRISHFF